MVSCNFDKKFYTLIMILVKFTSGAYRLKHAMTFLYEIIEYNITNEEPGQFKKRNENSNYRQNMLPINLDADK